MRRRIVIDTNAVINSLSRRSPFYAVMRGVLNEKFELVLSNEILMEYEEMLPKFFPQRYIDDFMGTLAIGDNIYHVSPTYAFNLSKDPDDNKFADAYLVANADVLVSNDKALLSLTSLTYPSINVMKIEDFAQLFEQEKPDQ